MHLSKADATAAQVAANFPQPPAAKPNEVHAITMHCMLVMWRFGPPSSNKVALASCIDPTREHSKAQLHGTQAATQHNYGELQGTAHLA